MFVSTTDKIACDTNVQNRISRVGKNIDVIVFFSYYKRPRIKSGVTIYFLAVGFLVAGFLAAAFLVVAFLAVALPVP